MTAIFQKTRGSIEVLEIVPGKKGRYAHRFGGVPTHSGIDFASVHPPLHLLYTFDLSDPRLDLPLKGARFLPLYYGFRYDATRLGYSMLSEQSVRIVHQEVTEPVPDFPYPGYPDTFTEISVELREKALAPLLQKEDPYNPFHKKILTQTGSGRDRDQILACLDSADTIAFAAGLPQGPSRSSCLQPKCPGILEIFCVIDPDAVAGVHLWDNDGEDEEVKIVYEMCPVCFLVRATNQCT